MDNILETLGGALGGEVGVTLARQMGVDEATARGLVRVAVPMLVAGLERNSRDPRGAASLAGALQTKHDGSVLDDVASFLSGGGDPADGAAILGHVFGGQRAAVTSGVGQATAIDPQLLQKAMIILAPLVLGYLGRRQRAEKLDTGGLSDLLRREERAIEKTAGAAGAGAVDLGTLLDLLVRDQGGDVKPDALRLGQQLLGALMSGRRPKTP